MTAIDTAVFGISGKLSDLSAPQRETLLSRAKQNVGAVRESVSRIIERVRRDGDGALREMSREFDGVTLSEIEVPRPDVHAALESIGPELRAALERAARNIRTVHEAAPPKTIEVESEVGVVVGRRPDPLSRVGVYAPGGRAAYASSVLMCAVPARVAGVREVIVCSPPTASGYPSAIVLAACAIANVDRVFAIGGAGAVAAMAYGTPSVPRVDRIVGPGNAYVAESKLQVMSAVGIDSPAGPSELLVICDASASASRIAAEAIAQAEHDSDACVVIVAVDESVAAEIEGEISRQLESAPRAEIARAALRANGARLVAGSTDDAIEFASAYAPEHLLLALSNADKWLGAIRNAGCVFVGESSSVVFGDYISGGNHVLPTGGLARSYSGLGQLDFVRWTTYQRVSSDAAVSLARDAALLADAEGLPGHASAARAWEAAR